MVSPGRLCPNPRCRALIKTARGKDVWIASVIDGGGFPKERWFCSQKCVLEFAEYRIRTFKKTLINIIKRGDETVILDDSKRNSLEGQTTFNTKHLHTKNTLNTMDNKLSLVLVLFAVLVSLGVASAGSVEIHLLKTGNTTYVYTDDMSPKSCNSTCVVTYDSSDVDCNETFENWLSDINDSVKSARSSITDVSAKIDNLKGNINGTMPSISKIGQLFDTQKSDLSTFITSALTTKMDEYNTQLGTWINKANEVDALKTQNAQLSLDLANANNRVDIAEKNEKDMEDLANSRMNMVYAAIVLAVFMFLISFNLLHVVPRKIKGE